MRTRRPRSRSTAILMAAVLGVAALAAPAPVIAQDGADAQCLTGREGTLVIGKDLTADVTMDPARALDDLYYVLFHAVYQKLVDWEFDPETGYRYDRLTGQLAESWEVSDDATTYTFRLNPDARFASGNSVTSEDVKFSLERLKNVKGNPSYLVAGLESVDTPDPSTAVINLAAPDSTFAGRLTYSNFAIIDSEVVKAEGGASGDDADVADQAERFLSSQSAGSGPFRMTQHLPGDRTVLERVDDWWGGGCPILERVIIQHIPDQSAQVAALSRGDIDMTWRLPPNLVEELEGEGFKPLGTTIWNWFELVLNADPANSEFVADPLVQQALKKAINYEELADLCPGASSPIAGVVPAGLRGGRDATATLSQDVEGAMALLAEAGYPDGYGSTEGESPVSITAPNNILFGFCPSHADVAQKIASDWNAIGVETDVSITDFGVWVSPFRSGDFEATIGDWYPDFPDPVNFIQAMLPQNSLAGRSRWDDAGEAFPGYATLAELQAAAISETDPDKRLDLIDQMEPLIIENSPIVPLLMIDQTHVYNPALEGLFSHSIARVDLTHLTHGPVADE